VFVGSPDRMNLLTVMASDYGVRPSSLLIPRAPAYLRWWLDEATVYLASARRETPAPPTAPSTSAAPDPRAPSSVGTISGGTVQFHTAGQPVPWVEQGPDGQWRQVARE
jgi:hypothetical protein